MGWIPPQKSSNPKANAVADWAVRTLLSGIDRLRIENALSFRVLLTTCVRTIELVKTRWEHADLQAGTWWVPDESVKTRRGFFVPLTPTVVGWFNQLKRLSGDSAWVLPARTARRYPHGAHNPMGSNCNGVRCEEDRCPPVHPSRHPKHSQGAYA